jgi:hypothetical protein
MDSLRNQFYSITVLQPFVGPWPFFIFSIHTQSVGLLGRGISPPTHRTTQTQNKQTQTSIHRADFELTTPVFERAKVIDALDRAATVIGT